MMGGDLTFRCHFSNRIVIISLLVKFCTDPKGKKLCVKRWEVRRELIEEEMIRIPTQKPIKVHKIEGIETKKVTVERDTSSKERKKPGRKKGWKRALEASTALDLNSISTTSGKSGKGSIPMSIPQTLMPEFCRRISAQGTKARMDVINGFAKDYPETSIRQATFKFMEVTTRERPSCVAPPEKSRMLGRSVMFYLRPRFYHMLPENERPDGWEEEAKADELLWQEEREAKAKSKARDEQKMRELMADKTGRLDDESEDLSVSEINASTVDTGSSTDDDDERPIKKKMKIR